MVVRLFLFAKAEPKPMPSIDYALTGYDIFKGNPTPTNGMLDPGFTTRIFAGKYDRKQTTADGLYHRPDGTDILDCMGDCSLDFHAMEIAGAKSYQKSLGEYVSASGEYDGSLFDAKFSASFDYKRVQSGCRESHFFYTKAEARCCKYNVNLHMYDLPPFEDNFRNALLSLPKEYDEQAYADFIDHFGTHYVSSVSMGALFGQQSAFTSQAWSKFEESKTDISVGARLSGFGATGAVNAKDEKEKMFAQAFSEAASQQQLYTLGQRPPTDGDAMKWMQEVTQHPAPMRLKLVPLVTLVDNQAYPGVKANLKTATLRYCQRLLQQGLVVGSCYAPGEDPAFPEPQLYFKWTMEYSIPYMQHHASNTPLVQPGKCSMHPITKQVYDQHAYDQVTDLKNQAIKQKNVSIFDNKDKEYRMKPSTFPVPWPLKNIPSKIDPLKIPTTGVGIGYVQYTVSEVASLTQWSHDEVLTRMHMPSAAKLEAQDLLIV
jgi:hypothetical protein